MERCSLKWDRLYVTPAQSKQAPCFAWSPLNFASVVTDKFVDIFNVLPFLEGKTLQAVLVAKISLADLASPKREVKEVKKIGRRRLSEPDVVYTGSSIDVVCNFIEKHHVDRIVSCAWSPLMRPIICVALNDGSVGVFELEAAGFARSQFTRRKVLVQPTGRTTLCNFLPNGDLITASATLTLWESPSFESKGDPRIGAAKAVEAHITATDRGNYGFSDGSVWDNVKNLWEARSVPVTCIGASAMVVCIAWGDVLGCVDLTRNNLKRLVDLRHDSLINSLCVYGTQFCAITANAYVTMWNVNAEMPKCFKAGPEQESDMQHGLSFRLHEKFVLPCVGASLSPGRSLLSVCTSGDAVLVQQYYRQRHLGSCVEVWVARNPMADSANEVLQRYFATVPRPLSIAEFIYADDEFTRDTEFIETFSAGEKNALHTELRRCITPAQRAAFLADRKSGINSTCFCGANNTLDDHLAFFTCPDDHRMAACMDSLTPIDMTALTVEVCDLCARTSATPAQAGVCSFCLHRTSLLLPFHSDARCEPVSGVENTAI